MSHRDSHIPNTDDSLILELCAGPLRGLSALEQTIFEQRLTAFLPDALRSLRLLYGHRPDFSAQVRRLVHLSARAYANRPLDLRHLDLSRLTAPDWFQRPDMLGYVCYTDRFAGSLRGVAEKIGYLKELDVTCLHLMPLLQPRSGSNDGGYAVRDYRQVDTRLGTMSDLADLTRDLRANGISLCIDLVCNHTAKEHEWARQAIAGDKDYQDYYLMFPDRTLPDQYELTTPEVFPDFAPGNFTYYPEIEQWVWTTFNEYQWDLNYANPNVFADMLDTIFFLANQGVEILRLDAVAFMWKRLGTDSQNQPEAHAILQAWRALTRLAAPGLLLLAEAIVSPVQLMPYLGRGPATNKTCELAYHNVFMVLLWSALAEQKTILMTHALQQMPPIPTGTAWLTYVRCHDDIGWAIANEDAAGVGLDGYQHRAFLSGFYSGRFPGTFATGSLFQYNPRTGDSRVSGSTASLAGLEIGLGLKSDAAIDLAIRRLLLLHSLLFVFGGIPLIYMGDEIGLLNDYNYASNPDLADDNRWLHRPVMNWVAAADRHDLDTIPGRIFQGLRQLIRARLALTPLHAQASQRAVWAHNEHVFALLRTSPRGHILVLANFSDQPQSVPAYRLAELGFDRPLRDHLSGRLIPGNQPLALDIYGTMWLEIDHAPAEPVA